MNQLIQKVEEQQLLQKFNKLKKAYLSAPFPTCQERVFHLKQAQQMIKQHEVEFVRAIAADFGHRSSHETQLLEIFPSLENLRHTLRHLKRWMKASSRRASFWFLPAKTKIMWQPLGVVGIMVPWNYPLYLAIGPLVAALAAGNRVMIKMSEFTPQTSRLFAKLIAQYFDEDHVTVVTGEAEVAQQFSSLAWDHLLFTGSTAVGHHIMRAAAQHLTPITLELGGKSPAWIAPDFPIEVAAERILFGKCVNAGQTCIAPDYVLLPEAQVEAFQQAAQKIAKRLYPEFPQTADYSFIINDQHYGRLQNLLQDAQAGGASILPLLPQPSTQKKDQRLIAPTLVTQVSDQMKIMQEEIFGPLLPLVPYREWEEAKQWINSRPRPLALYYFDYKKKRINRVLQETISGGVTINDTLLHISQDHLPFGGVGASGMGHYHGQDGFETFSKKKGVFFQSRINGVSLLAPPYGKRTEFLLKRMKG
ncbi:MAG: coniferyl-aldehyde dehydrogenase [SAR324 cluster bacterium]|uniref:Aldehyde dehydrogenase n=1 Tax=SAR324 cluster bacterium TaxID=2024889 RepID=A0A2A4T6K6_9DELT|nr:MAG: coniferyl-aldehyde dehydrogenase [SAR324 cluster bacterium]